LRLEDHHLGAKPGQQFGRGTADARLEPVMTADLAGEIERGVFPKRVLLLFLIGPIFLPSWPGFVPAIHVFLPRKTWMPASQKVLRSPRSLTAMAGHDDSCGASIARGMTARTKSTRRCW